MRPPLPAEIDGPTGRHGVAGAVFASGLPTDRRPPVEFVVALGTGFGPGNVPGELHRQLVRSGIVSVPWHFLHLEDRVLFAGLPADPERPALVAVLADIVASLACLEAD